MDIFTSLCFIFIWHKCIAIDLDDIRLLNCTNGLPCEESNTSPFTENVNDLAKKLNDGKIDSVTTESTISVDLTSQISLITQQSSSTTAMPVASTTAKNDVERNIFTQNHSDTCMCDLKISSCDINCCCDFDCNEFQMAAFSHCDNHRPKMYDSRYCYTKNFIQRNNTQFILDRLANNLFCIAYDNLPPINGMSEVPNLKNRQAFEQAKYSTNSKKFTWDWKNSIIPADFNFSSHYRHKDGVWKFQRNKVKLMELPQSGFTGKCAFVKKLEYLETSRWTCMQTDLNNDNPQLFATMYNDFTIISSPHLFNKLYITSENFSCPDSICLPLRAFYCSKSWTDCHSTGSVEQSCSMGKCRDIIKAIRYTIFHNGTSGIRSIEARFILANVSRSFYQNFEIVYEWITEPKGEKFYRSGNPGYSIGKPIIIGNIVSNATNDVKNEYVTVNESNYYLTLPLSGKDGSCIPEERYIVGFGENVRLKCYVKMTIHNFSSSHTCMDLQNRTLSFMMENSLRGVTEIDKYRSYASKTGDLSTNDISKWTQILLDRIPKNVVTGQIFNDQIHCSALVTSAKIEILYTVLPNHDDIDYYKIAGAAFTFSEPKDLLWPKCSEKNCTDIIHVELTSLVTFTDISTPSMYYYAGGPNLDIILPYDFFYPFMSNACFSKPFNVLLVIQSLGFVYYHV